MVSLRRILREIKDKNLVKHLRLTRGNCGCFAIALRHVLKKGDLFDIAHGAHVVLQVGSRYIDGTGIYSYKEIMGQWGAWGTGKVNNDEKKVLIETAKYHSIEEMEQILTLLSQGKSVRRFHVDE